VTSTDSTARRPDGMGSKPPHAACDHDFVTGTEELKANTELTRAIHTLTNDLHEHLVGQRPSEDGPGRPPSR
jgi:hypothetical protein